MKKFGALITIPIVIEPVLYMASGYDDALGDNYGRLFTLDFPTGVLHEVGPIGFGVTGIAIHPDTGQMYGVTNPNSPTHPRSLISINKDTGAGTYIGTWGTSPIPDICFDESGTLYGFRHIGSGNDRLVTIDLSTGAVTTIGTTTISGGSFGMGCAFHPTTGVLYLFPRGGVGQAFFTVDKVTAVPTQGPTITGSGVNWATGAIDFKPTDEVLYFIGNSGGETYLSTLDDLSTGASTFVSFPDGWFTFNGDTDTYVDAIAWGTAPTIAYPFLMSYQMHYIDGGDDPLQIYTLDRDSGVHTYLPILTLNSQRATFSPDRSKILFQATTVPGGAYTNAYVEDWDGANLVQLTTTGSNVPSWHPDSSKIVYCDPSGGVGGLTVSRVNADGTGHTVLYTPPAGTVQAASYNYDGTKIAFVRYVSPNWTLWVMNADGSGAINVGSMVSPNPNYEYAYCWANTHDKIAYITSIGEYWTVDSTGSTYQQILVPGAMPGVSIYSSVRAKCWYPDDSGIILGRFNGSTGWQLWKVRANGTGDFAVNSEYTSGGSFQEPVFLHNRIWWVRSDYPISFQYILMSCNVNGGDIRYEKYGDNIYLHPTY